MLSQVNILYVVSKPRVLANLACLTQRKIEQKQVSVTDTCLFCCIIWIHFPAVKRCQ